jgi:hypothetical protein
MVGILIACMLALSTLVVGGDAVEPEVASCVEADCCEGEDQAPVEITIPPPVRSAHRLRFAEHTVVASHHEHELLRPPEA